jgi:thiamine biosynthesis lipoprotein
MRVVRRTLFLPIGLAGLALLTGIACSQSPRDREPDAPVIVERTYVTMGSALHVTAWTADAKAALTAFGEVFDEFDRLDHLLSVWKAGSDVTRINDAAGRAPVAVSQETRQVLRMARQVGDWTGGKFDVTFGALSDVWKFDHDQDGRVPTREQIAARLPLVDYAAIEVDDAKGTAFLRRSGMRVHLGGIGKGFAVDRAVAILRARGVRDFLVQAGGDFYASGLRGNRPWRAGIQDPRGQGGASFAALDLRDGTFSTSGDYERFFLKDGRRYHHILDPDLGEPAHDSRSVTIVADSAMLADGLSTGVFIMGPVDGMALIERLPNVEGVIVTSRNEVLVSSGLRDRLEMLAQPSDAP